MRDVENITVIIDTFMEHINRFPDHLYLEPSQYRSSDRDVLQDASSCPSGETFSPQTDPGDTEDPSVIPKPQVAHTQAKERESRGHSIFQKLQRYVTLGMAALTLFGGFAAMPVTAREILPQETVQERVVQNDKSTAPSAAESQKQAPVEQEKTAPEYNKEAGEKIAKAAKLKAGKTGTEGRCYRAVKSVLRKNGIYLTGKSAYMAASQLASNPKMAEITVSADDLGDLKPGSVVVWSKTKANRHGHISIALGDGNEASDHVQEQLTSLRGSTSFRVFIPIK